MRLYGRLVQYWCHQAGLQAVDRSDVFQEVSRTVARHIGSFRHDRPGDTFRGWLRRITVSRIQDHFRRKGRQPVVMAGGRLPDHALIYDDESSNSEHESCLRENHLLVREALNQVQNEFEERTWQAFWRTVADSLSTSVVADQLGMTTGAVRKAKSRILCRLREELAGLME